MAARRYTAVSTDTVLSGRAGGPARESAVTSGDRVRVLVPLPGRPVGLTGSITAVERLWITVQFPDGRLGYYTAQQLEACSEESRDLPSEPALP